ncbi:MAG: N-acetyltransferase family protein [Acidobacteria bacterium]|nr:N-acetyltransferase family protein [Acidobacteriota bacterium]MCA1643093.1 N-acetyltransferase family protein [Acidobacteriota bacterium]
MEVSVEDMRDDDWVMVRAIYLEGIATGDATFETEAPTFEAWDAAHLRECRLVARAGGEIAGWAALSPVSSRRVHGGVAEVSVYVAGKFRGRGVGRALLAALVEESERNDLWTLQAGVLAENEASVRLHAACGFRVVGRRERLGKLKGAWRDVVLLERRSAVVGND